MACDPQERGDFLGSEADAAACTQGFRIGLFVDEERAGETVFRGDARSPRSASRPMVLALQATVSELLPVPATHRGESTQTRLSWPSRPAATP